MIPNANVVYFAQIPLEVHRNVPGLALAADANSGAVGIALPPFDGDIMTIYVDGLADMWFALGIAGDVCTLACPAVPRGAQLVYLLSPEVVKECTHIFVRTRSGSTTATLSFHRRGS